MGTLVASILYALVPTAAAKLLPDAWTWFTERRERKQKELRDSWVAEALAAKQEAETTPQGAD